MTPAAFLLAISAPEAAAETAMIITWLAVGFIALVGGLIAVAGANRRFKETTRVVRQMPVPSVQVETAAAAAAA